MNIEEIIQVIVDNGRVEDMHELSDILEDTIEHLEKCNPEKYKEYEMQLYIMAYGCTFNKDMAKKIVSNMKPYGEKWTMDETENIQRQYGLNNIDENDFYIVINSAYNDYRDIFKDDIEMYIRFTNDFINDEDSKQDKVFIYFTQIPE